MLLFVVKSQARNLKKTLSFKLSVLYRDWHGKKFETEAFKDIDEATISLYYHLKLIKKNVGNMSTTEAFNL